MSNPSHTGFRALFQLTSLGRVIIRTGVALPLGERGAILFPCRDLGACAVGAGLRLSGIGIGHGRVPEWLKGTDCKSVGFAYAGSNPALSTIPLKPA